MRLLAFIFCLLAVQVNAQPLWRNFFTTNQNPRVTVVAGSNATVQASTVGLDQRIFTVNGMPSGADATNGLWTAVGVATNQVYQSSTNTAGTYKTDATNGLWTAATGLTNVGGLKVYGSNVVSGGQVPIAALSPNAGADGWFLIQSNGVSEWSRNGASFTNVGNAYLANNQVFTGSNYFSQPIGGDGSALMLRPFTSNQRYRSATPIWKLRPGDATFTVGTKATIATNWLDAAASTNYAALSITATQDASSVYVNYALPIATNVSFNGLAPVTKVRYYVDGTATNLSDVRILVGDAAFANFSTLILSTPGVGDRVVRGWQNYAFGPSEWQVSGGGAPWTAVENIRIALYAPTNTPSIIFDSIEFLPRNPKAVVALTFDDYQIQLTKAAAYLSQKGLRGTFYTIGSFIDGGSGMTVSNLTAMRAAGHLIANHTLNNNQWQTDLAGNTSLMLQDFMREATWLMTNSFGNGAYIGSLPGGTGELAEQPYRLLSALSQVRLTGAPNGQSGHPFSIAEPGIFYTAGFDSTNNATKAIARSITNGGISVVGFHSTSITDGSLFPFVDWLAEQVRTNNVQVVTMDELNNADQDNAVSQTLLTKGAITSSTTITATNGFIHQGKHSFNTNFTVVQSIQIYNCNGTNQVITLPNCTNSTAWQIYRFSCTNGYAKIILTNANGLQTIRDGTSLSFTQIGVGEVGFYHDGAHWWIASKAKTIFPVAQFSTSTNIPLTAANTAYPVTFNSTDFNNSQGIALGVGTNGFHSKMWITNSGQYEFDPSVVQSFNGNDTIRFWFRKWDTNIANSATPSKGQNGSIRVITVPFIVNVTEPTPFEIWAESDTTGEELLAGGASGNYPAAPSVICPIKRVSDTWP